MVTTDVNTVTYNGNGSNTAFPFTFKIQDASEINLQLVYGDGTVTDITSDFYVDTVNSTVHYPGYAPGSEPAEADQPAPVQTGHKLTIWRDVPMTQEADLGDKWPFEEIENGLDKLTMICQQIYAYTNRKLDAALASMFQLAGIVTDSDKLQHITDQYNAIDANAASAAESEENAAASATAAAESATASANSANDSAGSATSATNTANALINFLNTKETLTAPAVDPTLTISGAAADAQVTGDSISGLNKQIQALHSVAISGDLNNHATSTTYGLTIETDGCVTKLNGTVSGTSNNLRIFPIQENPPKGYTSSGFTGSCTISNTLIGGHTYRTHGVLVDGTVTIGDVTYGAGKTFNTDTLDFVLYGFEDGHNIGTKIIDGDGNEFTPENDMTVGALVFRFNGGKIFNNAVIVAYLEDVTLTSLLNTTDKTLSVVGMPADADAVGKAINNFFWVDRASDINQELYRIPYIPTTFRLGENGVNPITGAGLSLSTHPELTGTNYVPLIRPIAFVCENVDYEYTIWAYSASSASAGVKSLTNRAYVPAGTYVNIPLYDPIVTFKVGFRRVDGQNMDADTDYPAILASCKMYTKHFNVDNSGDSFKLIGRETSVGHISALTVMNGYLAVFPYVSGNVDSTGYFYPINEDGTINTGRKIAFSSNIGHQNCVDYSEGNGHLICSKIDRDNGIYTIYLIPAEVSANTSFNIDAVDAVGINLMNESNVGTYAIYAIWGQSNLNKYDMAYVFSLNAEMTTWKISLFQFGKGSNDLGSGTLIPGKGDDEFNGTYQIIKSIDYPRQTIGGIYNGNNDACYWGGKIYEAPAPSSPSGLAVMIHSFEDFGTRLSTQYQLIEVRSANGQAINQEREGIAIYRNRLYMGTHAAGLYIYEL